MQGTSSIAAGMHVEAFESVSTITRFGGLMAPAVKLATQI